MRTLICLSYLSLFLCSCLPENSLPDESTDDLSNIDIELKEFFIAFENAAVTRGVEMDLSEFELTGSIEEIHQENVAGICHYNSNLPNRITIDKSFWKNSSKMLKEMVVFHELGHCVLARGHREAENQNGHCLSIMRSGTGTCTTLYNANNRKYYLDELFFYEE